MAADISQCMTVVASDQPSHTHTVSVSFRVSGSCRAHTLILFAFAAATMEPSGDQKHCMLECWRSLSRLSMRKSTAPATAAGQQPQVIGARRAQTAHIATAL